MERAFLNSLSEHDYAVQLLISYKEFMVDTLHKVPHEFQISASFERMFLAV